MFKGLKQNLLEEKFVIIIYHQMMQLNNNKKLKDNTYIFKSSNILEFKFSNILKTTKPQVKETKEKKH